MNQRDTLFVVPTYRLREVGETIESYDLGIRCEYEYEGENRESVS